MSYPVHLIGSHKFHILTLNFILILSFWFNCRQTFFEGSNNNMTQEATACATFGLVTNWK